MHGGQRLGFVDYNFYFPLSARFCLCSARAAANWAEIAEQLGKIVELQKYSQQNVVTDRHGQPCIWSLWMDRCPTLNETETVVSG